MFTEVALITVSCVLFIQMGLCEAIMEFMRVRLPIVSCQKCLTWWMCLCYLLSHDYGIILSVSASFIASYGALWLSLLYDKLAIIYNRLYDEITQTEDTSQASERAKDTTDTQAGGDEVS